MRTSPEKNIYIFFSSKKLFFLHVFDTNRSFACLQPPAASGVVRFVPKTNFGVRIQNVLRSRTLFTRTVTSGPASRMLRNTHETRELRSEKNNETRFIHETLNP